MVLQARPIMHLAEFRCDSTEALHSADFAALSQRSRWPGHDVVLYEKHHKTATVSVVVPKILKVSTESAFYAIHIIGRAG